MIADWRTGGQGDGLDGQVAADLSWQPHLWRLVLQQVGGEPPDVRLDRVVAALSAGTHDAGDLTSPAVCPSSDTPGSPAARWPSSGRSVSTRRSTSLVAFNPPRPPGTGCETAHLRGRCGGGTTTRVSSCSTLRRSAAMPASCSARPPSRRTVRKTHSVPATPPPGRPFSGCCRPTSPPTTHRRPRIGRPAAYRSWTGACRSMPKPRHSPPGRCGA